MRGAALLLPVLAWGLAATAAAAQDAHGATGHRDGIDIYSPAVLDAVAGTPSRIAPSRGEMNRGRDRPAPSPGPVAIRRQADSALRRGGFVCTVLDAAVVGRAREGRPLIEVDCAEGGGMIVADTDPVQATDCLDLAPDAGRAGRGRRVIAACRLAGNVAAVAQAQSARN